MEVELITPTREISDFSDNDFGFLSSVLEYSDRCDPRSEYYAKKAAFAARKTDANAYHVSISYERPRPIYLALCASSDMVTARTRLYKITDRKGKMCRFMTFVAS